MKLNLFTYSQKGTVLYNNKPIRNYEELLKITGYKKLDTLKNKLDGIFKFYRSESKNRVDYFFIVNPKINNPKKPSKLQIELFKNGYETEYSKKQISSCNH